MKNRPSSHKRNSKSLLSTTIEQIKNDLKFDYDESFMKGNKTNIENESDIKYKFNKPKKIQSFKNGNNAQKMYKKTIKKNISYINQETEKTTDENINYKNIINLKTNKEKQKKLIKLKMDYIEPNKKEKNININNSNYNERNISKNNYSNYYQISTKSCNGNESILQNQIKDLKIKSQNMKDKLTIFLKLMKKYSSKLTTLANSNSRNNLIEKKNTINKEIQSTLSQLNKMLNNPKLNEDIFNLQEITINHNINNDSNYNNIITNQTLLSNINNKNEEDINTNIINSNLITTEINEDNEYAKDIEGLIEKYEEKINLLNNENNILKKNKIEQNNYLNNLETEVNELKDKLKNEKINYENNLIKLNNDSITLRQKVNYLQDENNLLKKNCVELSQNLSKVNNNNYEPKDMEKELEYKNNVIKYLERLLHNSGINYHNYPENIINTTKNSEKIKYSNEHIDISLSSGNITNKNKNKYEMGNNKEKENEISRKYFTFYNANQPSIDSSKFSLARTTCNFNTYSPKIIEQEIDDIDKEIVDLQTQLKNLLNY